MAARPNGAATWARQRAGRCRRAILIAIVTLAGNAAAGETPVPPLGSAHLHLTAAGAEVQVALVAPAATLTGFAHAPRTDDERATLRLARENLRIGDGMIRFNTTADCRLVEARTDFVEERQTQGLRAALTAHYRFRCERPERLDSAALGLFMGFPALERALIWYALQDVRGGAELTPGNPVVTFVPL